MFGFFKKKKAVVDIINFAGIGTDIHSHLIPNIDDGSDSLETSIALLKGFADLGFKHIITTPHIMFEVYDSRHASILSGLKTLQERLHTEGVDITLRAAAEYFLDDHFLNLLNTEPLLTVWENEVLVEMSFYAPPRGIYDYLFQIGVKGYQPILAHPERYGYYHDNYAEYQVFKDKGIKFQLNILSLIGYYGESVKKTALRLIKDNLIDYLGSDVHHIKHLSLLKEHLADPELQRILLEYPFQNVHINKSTI